MKMKVITFQGVEYSHQQALRLLTAIAGQGNLSFYRNSGGWMIDIVFPEYMLCGVGTSLWFALCDAFGCKTRET